MQRTDRELLQLALDKFACASDFIQVEDKLIEEIRARLAEPDDEPVCWFDENYSGIEEAFSWIPEGDHTIPLYRNPRQPVRLSDEEIENLFEENPIGKCPRIAIARAIEKAVLEKNQ